MKRIVAGCVAATLVGLAVAAAQSPGHRREPLSMQMTVLQTAQVPGAGKWNELLGRPLVALEYEASPETGTGARVLYLHDARSGECRAVLHAPASPGQPMLVAWAPCK
jgi:hypothetical protein